MISDEKGLELHHKSVCGYPLTDEERVMLQVWYAIKDAEEAKMLKQNARPDADLVKLRSMVFAAIKRMEDIDKRIKVLIALSEKLQLEKVTLLKQLEEKIGIQSV